MAAGFAGVVLLALLAVAAPDSPIAKKGPPLGIWIRDLAFSPDGKLLAAVTGEPKQRGQVILWDVATRRPRWVHLEANGVPAAAFAPDGRALAIAVYDKTAKLLDVQTGAVQRTLTGHAKEIRGVAFAPDGKTLATASWDRTVRLWNLPAGTVLRTLEGHGQRVYEVRFSPDGRTLAAVGDQAVSLWDVGTGQRRSLKGEHGSVVRGVGYSPDGRFLATACWDGYTRIWDAATDTLRLAINTNSSERAVFSPDGRLLAVCGLASFVQLFPVALESGGRDAERVAGLVARLDDDDYKVRVAATEHLRKEGLRAEPALRRAVKESKSAELRIRARRILGELLSQPAVMLGGHSGEVDALAFAPSGRILASGAKDGTIKLWDLATNREVASFGVSGQ
jgi:WD40 repeat protein